MKLFNKEVSNQKTIIVVAILVVLLAGGIFALQYFKSPVQIVEDETAGWQTYRNSEYGFEIKYPQSFFFREYHNPYANPLEVGFISNECEGQEVRCPAVFIEFVGSTDLVIEEWVYEHYGDSVQNITEERINDISMKKGTFLQGNLVFVKNKNDGLYIISRPGHGVGVVTFVPESTFKQMLSTFKFLE